MTNGATKGIAIGAITVTVTLALVTSVWVLSGDRADALNAINQSQEDIREIKITARELDLKLDRLEDKVDKLQQAQSELKAVFQHDIELP